MPDRAVQALRMESLKLVVQAEMLLDALNSHQANLQRFLDEQKRERAEEVRRND